MFRTLIIVITCVTSACNHEQSGVTQTDQYRPDSVNYIGPHHEHHKLTRDINLSTEAQWDSLNGRSGYSRSQHDAERDPEHKVFGWHLYSQGSAYASYDFSLLWGVSYFSYHVDPKTGGYESIHEWSSTDLVNQAHAKGCKVFLSVSLFGADEISTFLNDPGAVATLAGRLVSHLEQREADGINIDFEGIPSGYTDKFSRCVTILSHTLKAHNPELMVSVALYTVDYHHVFDIKVIDPAIDFYTLMAYDYYGGFSSRAGPVSPLENSAVFGTESISTSVKYYLDQGVHKDKLIVGLPYYGAEWQVKEGQIPAPVIKFISHPPYNTIRRLYIDSLNYMVNHDEQSLSAYTTFTDETGVLRQLWFDDSLTLARKYDWIKSHDLGGVGIWLPAYGYDDEGLWDLLRSKFGAQR